MKKRCVLLTLLSIVTAGPGYAEPPPAVYQEAVRRQRENRFNSDFRNAGAGSASQSPLWRGQFK